MADAYANNLRRAGFGAEIEAVHDKFHSGDRQGARMAISERLVDAVTFCGRDHEARDYVTAYFDAGVDEVLVNPLPWGDDEPAETIDTHFTHPALHPPRHRILLIVLDQLSAVIEFAHRRPVVCDRGLPSEREE